METWIMQNTEDLQGMLFLALVVVLAGLEYVVPARSGKMNRRQRWPANLGLTFLNLLTLGILPLTFVGAARWAEVGGTGLFNLLEVGFAGGVVLTLLARGFISFFTHYLMHKVPAFWSVHRIHHLDTELNVSSTVRFHPLEFVIALIPGVPLIIMLGLSPWVLALWELLDVIVTLFSHANIRLPRGVNRILRYIVVTPDLHRIHHSSWQPETDSNFSAVFPIWDLLLGTFRPDSRNPQETMELGLEDVRDERTNQTLWLLLEPFRATKASPVNQINTQGNES